VIGLVHGAISLAMARHPKADRNSVTNWDGEIGFATRHFAAEFPEIVPVSHEYYRIIDRITRGEKP